MDFDSNVARIRSSHNGSGGNAVSRPLGFFIGSSEKLRIDSNGRILIGHSSTPTAALSVAVVGSYGASSNNTPFVYLCRDEAATAITANESLGQILFASNDGYRGAVIEGVAEGAWSGSSSDASLVFKTTPDNATVPTERLRIDSNGSVRIENTNYAAQAAGNEFIVGTTSGDNGITIVSGSSGTGNIFFGDGDSNGIGYIRYDHNSNFLKFNVNGSEKLRINSDGYLGLGTNNPNTPLHVYHSTTNGVALFQSGDAYCNLILQDGNSNTSSKPQFGVQGDDFRFVSTGTERLRISSSGGSTFYNDVTIDTTAAATSADLTIRAGEGGSAYLYMIADDGDDGGDNWRIAAMSGFSNRLIFYNSASGSYTDVVSFQTDGTIRPGTNSANLGTSTERWANVYTNDLHLSNQGSTNSVDNTWGDFTIQEGESDLFLINNRNGKKYKFNLTEVS